jgi:hypothetical protein
MQVIVPAHDTAFDKAKDYVHTQKKAKKKKKKVTAQTKTQDPIAFRNSPPQTEDRTREESHVNVKLTA